MLDRSSTMPMMSSATTPDPDLTDAIAAGDRDARDRFCRCYLPFVIRRLRSRWKASPIGAMIPDATQEVFLECLRENGALAHFDPARGNNLDAYVQGVVRNVAGRIERREARNAARCQRCGDRILFLQAPGPALPDGIERSLVNEAVRAAVNSLDREPAIAGKTLGDLVRLHFREGKAVREIAAEWGQPASRVHELRRRACARLRDHLRRSAEARSAGGADGTDG